MPPYAMGDVECPKAGPDWSAKSWDTGRGLATPGKSIPRKFSYDVVHDATPWSELPMEDPLGALGGRRAITAIHSLSRQLKVPTSQEGRGR